MNLSEIHSDIEEVSAKPISRETGGKAIAIQLLKGGRLKEHITKTPAVLVCVLGEVAYEDEKNARVVLRPGDYYEIEPMVKHRVSGLADSQLILIK